MKCICFCCCCWVVKNGENKRNYSRGSTKAQRGFDLERSPFSFLCSEPAKATVCATIVELQKTIVISHICDTEKESKKRLSYMENEKKSCKDDKGNRILEASDEARECLTEQEKYDDCVTTENLSSHFQQRNSKFPYCDIILEKFQYLI